MDVESGLGSFGPKLTQNLSKAGERIGEARAACDAADTKRAKARLGHVKKALGQYAHRLKGRPARKRLDPALRADYLAAGDRIAPDVTTLRSGLDCP